MKKYFLGACAITLAVSFSAFTNAFDSFYFTSGDLDSQISYQTSPITCEGAEHVCQINAPMTNEGKIDLEATVVVGSSNFTVLERIQEAESSKQTNETVLSLKN